MHELTLAESVLQLLEEAAVSQGFERVKVVWLEVGQLACVDVDALKYCFEVVTGDSIAAGAKIEILDIPGRAWCPDCATQVTIAALYEACPLCGQFRLEILGGSQMRVKEIDVA